MINEFNLLVARSAPQMATLLGEFDPAKWAQDHPTITLIATGIGGLVAAIAAVAATLRHTLEIKKILKSKPANEPSIILSQKRDSEETERVGVDQTSDPFPMAVSRADILFRGYVSKVLTPERQKLMPASTLPPTKLQFRPAFRYLFNGFLFLLSLVAMLMMILVPCTVGGAWLLGQVGSLINCETSFLYLGAVAGALQGAVFATGMAHNFIQNLWLNFWNWAAANRGVIYTMLVNWSDEPHRDP